jgi:hypothetical protein
MGSGNIAALQQRHDAYVDGLKRSIDAHEQREDEIDSAAYLIAKRVVQDRERLVGMVTRGELLLHEITFSYHGRTLSIEQALIELVSSAAEILDNSRAGDIARALIEHLEQDAEIRAQAEEVVDNRAVLSA